MAQAEAINSSTPELYDTQPKSEYERSAAKDLTTKKEFVLESDQGTIFDSSCY